MREKSYKDKKNEKRIKKQQYTQLIQNSFMNKLLNSLIYVNEDLNFNKDKIKFFTEERNYIACCHSFIGINLPHNLNNINNINGLITRIENCIKIDIQNLNIEHRNIIIGAFIIFHELGHLIHFRKLNLKRNISDIDLNIKISKIQKRWERASNKKEKYNNYVNSFIEKFADQYAIKQINKLIEQKFFNKIY